MGKLTDGPLDRTSRSPLRRSPDDLRPLPRSLMCSSRRDVLVRIGRRHLLLVLLLRSWRRSGGLVLLVWNAVAVVCRLLGSRRICCLLIRVVLLVL